MEKKFNELLKILREEYNKQEFKTIDERKIPVYKFFNIPNCIEDFDFNYEVNDQLLITVNYHNNAIIKNITKEIKNLFPKNYHSVNAGLAIPMIYDSAFIIEENKDYYLLVEKNNTIEPIKVLKDVTLIDMDKKIFIFASKNDAYPKYDGIDMIIPTKLEGDENLINKIIMDSLL